MSFKWEALSSDQAPLPADLSGTFSIKARAVTDIWRPTVERNVFNAPAIITRLKASEFRSISVTVSAKWLNKYDQGGLLLVFPGKSGAKPQDVKSWIKCGVENDDGHAQLGAVGCYAFSDYSLCPMLDESGTASIKLVREKQAIWIYAVHNGKDVPVRELTWAFLEDRDGDAEIWTGVYAARPTKIEGNPEAEHEVQFSGLQLITG